MTQKEFLQAIFEMLNKYPEEKRPEIAERWAQIINDFTAEYDK